MVDIEEPLVGVEGGVEGKKKKKNLWGEMSLPSWQREYVDIYVLLYVPTSVRYSTSYNYISGKGQGMDGTSPTLSTHFSSSSIQY